nr:unnamed protein product [Spirometra erinaceieuropaei]
MLQFHSLSLSLSVQAVGRSLYDIGKDTPSQMPCRRQSRMKKQYMRHQLNRSRERDPIFEHGQLEGYTGCTFIWSGRPKAERRDAGVAFAIRNDSVGRLPCLSQGINGRLRCLRLLLPGGKFRTIISAHTPTMTDSDLAKTKFYEDLNALLATVLKVDRFIVLGEGLLGLHGLGSCSENGRLLLLLTCVETSLFTANTSHLPTQKKASWMHHRSRHQQLLYQILARRRA